MRGARLRGKALEPPLFSAGSLLCCLLVERPISSSSSHQLGDLLVIGSCVKGRSPGVSSHGLEREFFFLEGSATGSGRATSKKESGRESFFRSDWSLFFLESEGRRCRSTFFHFFRREKRGQATQLSLPLSLLSLLLLLLAERTHTSTRITTMASAVRSKATALASAATKAASPAIESATKHFNKLIADNAQYVVKDKDAADKLAKQLVFTKLAR